MAPDLSRLSPRMHDVYALDQQGLRPIEIGRRLLLSEHAVKIMLEDIRLRLDPPSDEDYAADRCQGAQEGPRP